MIALNKTIKIILVIILCLYLADLLVMLIIIEPEQFKTDLLKISDSVKLYILINNGKFPENEEELLSRKVLKMVDNKYYIARKEFLRNLIDHDSNEASLNNIKNLNYIIVRNWGKFNFCYGVKIENIVEQKGYLYDKNSNRPILLINGPRKWLYKDIYKTTSFELYKIMLKEHNTHEK